MSFTKWTYLLGDAKATGDHELALIVRKVFNSMIKTRAESTILSLADFNSFRNDVSDFNDQIATWGEYWRSAFSTCKFGHSLLLRELMYDFYTRLLPNASYLSL